MTTTPAGIQKLSLTRLAPSPFNVRRLRTEARIAEVAESLAADGQQEPITVYPGTGKEAGTYLIVSGVTRYLAATFLHWKTLDARVDATLDPANTLALVKASRLHNDTHRETELDHAILARALEEAGHTTEEIAQALGYGSRRGVTRLKTYFELPASILELGSTKPEKFSASFEELFRKFVRVSGEKKTLALVKCVLEEDLSLRETTRRFAQARQRRGQRRSRRTRSLELCVGGRSAGRLKVLVTPDRQRKIQFLATLDETKGEALGERLDALLRQFMEEGGAQDAKNSAFVSQHYDS
jgi:ParB/RepB/Spo0J family partition protein